VHALTENSFAAAKTLIGSSFGPLFNPDHEPVSGAPVEYSGCDSVERRVRRARVIFALLFPAFWLAASTNCLLDPVSGSSNNATVSLVFGNEHARHDAADSACSFEQSARRWNRRLNDQSGPSGTPTPVTISQFQLPELEPTKAFSVGSGCSFELAQCWQFRWRTALEPRAPSSSVS